MLQNWFLTTWRNFRKQKTYSILNITGLAVGMACAGLIFLWVQHEVGFDKHHKNRDRVFGIVQHWKMDGNIRTWWSTPGPMAPAISQSIPGVQFACRTSESPVSPLVTVGDRSFYSKGLYADSTVFDIFTIPFTEGSPRKAFSQLYSIVLTESGAEKFFGQKTNIVGKMVKFNHDRNYLVTGVVQDPPSTSTLTYEWLAPFEVYHQQNQYLSGWGSNSILTYVMLRKNVDTATISSQLQNLVRKNVTHSLPRPILLPMKDWRLRNNFEDGVQTGGRIEYVKLFSIIAWIILVIACINFMNLATARSEKRAREVGVKKVLGAGNGSLVAQFMGEALFLSLLASILAIVLVVSFLPLFNELVNKNLSVNLLEPAHLLGLLGLTIGCGIVAGSYPSIYLSSFNPVFVLKGLKLKTASAAYIRKALVVLQFTVSIVLIIGTVIVYQQTAHVKARNLGFDKEHLIQINGKGDIMKRYAAVKNDLLQTGVVESTAMADYGILFGGNNTDQFYWNGKDPSRKILTSQRMVGPGYVRTTGLELIGGREFNETDTGETSAGLLPVMITASLEKLMGEGSAVGKNIYANNGSSQDSALKLTVIGVVNDYLYGDMYGKPDPVIFFYSPSNANSIYVRTKTGQEPEQVVSRLEAVIRKHNPAYPFEYQFVSDQFSSLFTSEVLIGKLSRVFAVLAIIICCLGLFGLAAYTAEQRFREIGIRKVLGATSFSVARLLSLDFLKLVMLSCLVAFPLALWVMSDWLNQYAYRISVQPRVFLYAGVLAIVIALVTITFQTLKASIANPVRVLRNE